jgi:CO/xanthine dehydrogenase FAD-binding subunit
MTLGRFEYHAPQSIPQAVQLLTQLGPDARVMAGGTDLLVKMRHHVVHPSAIVAIKGIPGLDRIEVDRDHGLTIGAAALLADVATHPQIQALYPAVSGAAQTTANVQVRNMGTVVGNLCNASPAADNAPSLLALEAQVEIQGPRGVRHLPLAAFFKGPGQTALAVDEIVTAVKAPPPRPASAGVYLSLSARGQLDCSAVGVGVVLALENQVCVHARIVIGACAPTPIRVPQAEALLEGRRWHSQTIEQAAGIAASLAQPIDDLRASARYRHRMITVLAQRALVQAGQSAAKK